MSNQDHPAGGESSPGAEGAPAPAEQSAKSRRATMVMWILVGAMAVAFLGIAFVTMNNG